jgi:hypothetical protein
VFEQSLASKLKRIFDFDKVTYDLPSESQEQEAVFVVVDKCISSIKEQTSYAHVEGKIRVFANAKKLPYGYFYKKIQEADSEDTKDIFFHEFEENVGRYLDIAERSLSFVYFFNGQYDPDKGTINQVDIQVEEDDE